jgi:DNA-binding CsgD family transcriptional regulator
MSGLAPAPHLHGRDAEIRAIGEALDLLDSGRPAIVLVEGEAGIGKSRLLVEAVHWARERGCEVSVGRGEELERSRPFGLVADAFRCVRSSDDPRRAAIAGLLATHGGRDAAPITVTSDPGLQFCAVDAFVDLAEDLALRAPLLIGLDDLQWADPSSLLTVSALCRRLVDVPLGLIGCVRPLPYAAHLERFAASLQAAGASRLVLAPLSDDAVSDLAAEAVAAEPGPDLLAEVARAGGNPLFVTELLGAITQAGAVQIAQGRAELTRRAPAETLRLTILRRLGFLSPEALQTLQAASILGSSFSLADLSIVTGRTALDLSRTMAEAIAGAVLSDDGVRLRFRHELIRDAIYSELPGSVRLGLHRDAGQRLAAAGAPAQQVAEHLARGAAPAEAVDWLIRAGRDAASTSPAVAVSMLERAIGLLAADDPVRDRLLAERAGSLMWAGRAEDSEAACRALLERAHDPAVDGSVRMCLGYALLAAGRPREALRELETAGRSPQLADAERAGGLGWAALTRLWLGDLDGAASLSEQVRSAAGDPAITSFALCALGGVATARARLPDALTIIDDAVRQADESPGRHGHRYPAHADRGLILTELDRLDETADTLRVGARISDELGVGWQLPSYLVVCVVRCFIAGQWDDAVAEVEACVEMCNEFGVRNNLPLARSVLALIRLHRNDLAAAARAADMAADYPGPWARSLWTPWVRALTLEAGGSAAEAYAALGAVWDECTEKGTVLEHRVMGADLVRLAVANGDGRRANTVASAVEQLAKQNDLPSLNGAALRCRGLAEGDPALLTAAVEAYERAPRPLELAQACEDASAAYVRSGNAEEARPRLERALEIYERLGATRDILRAEAALRGLGVRRGRRGTRRRPQAGWASLTPTERSIVGLVAEGLSNPQVGQRLYVSPRTVQTHLAHVFAKLDISSRAQLAAEATRSHDSD